jgi:hypothetical protein
MRAWWRDDPGLQQRADAIGNNYWRSAWTYKTYTRNRIHILIYNHQPGGVHWYVESDNLGAKPPSNYVRYWAENPGVKVPLNQWFLVEVYYHRAPDDTGRFFFAVNGQVVVDHHGLTMPGPWEEVNNIAHASIYTTQKTPGYKLIDDIEVRSAPPCASLPCGAG